MSGVASNFVLTLKPTVPRVESNVPTSVSLSLRTEVKPNHLAQKVPAVAHVLKDYTGCFARTSQFTISMQRLRLLRASKKKKEEHLPREREFHSLSRGTVPKGQEDCLTKTDILLSYKSTI